MATKKTAAFPYKWPNGTYHSRPYNTGAGAPKAKFTPAPTTNKPTTMAPASGSGTGAVELDAGLEARRASNEARRSTLLGDADVDLQQTAQETGFKYDPSTGAFGGFDAANPFSQAALLNQTRNETVSRTKQSYAGGNSYASGSQLYSGAYQGAQASVQSDYDKGYDTLKRGFDDYVKRYLRRKRDIQSVDPSELATL